MSAPKLGFEESLEEIVSSGRCVGCAACVITCPFNSLEYKEERPKLIGECKNCEICLRICPRYDFSWPSLERYVFGRERKNEEELGIYRQIVVARSLDNEILEICQDGGVVTSLLKLAFEEGYIDGAVVSSDDEQMPLYPLPKLALSTEEILKAAGTKYFYSPNLFALLEGIKRRIESIAFVGTPCQVHAIRKMQMASLKKYTRALRFTIGLMCTESFTYNGLMEEYVKGALGIDLRDVKKMNIKGKILVETKQGNTISISLKKAKEYARSSCNICNDFSAELADISVGGVGLDGWTFTVIRTEKGEEIFNRAKKEKSIETKPIENEQKALGLAIRLSNMKRKRTL